MSGVPGQKAKGAPAIPAGMARDFGGHVGWELEDGLSPDVNRPSLFFRPAREWCCARGNESDRLGADDGADGH